jgi:tetratricopeptide (TPR) repeat protein
MKTAIQLLILISLTIEGISQTSLEYIGKGNAKMNQKDYKGAISDYTQAIGLNKKSSEAYYLRGTAKTKLEQYNLAYEDFNVAVDLNPKSAKAYYGRAQSQILRLNEYTNLSETDQQFYQWAIEDLTKAIEINPKYTMAYIALGSAKFNRKDQDIPGAIDVYTKVIEIDPKCIQAYFNRGKAKYDFHDTLGAISDFDKAIVMNPKYGEAYFSRANAKYGLKDFNAAIADYSKAIEIDPKIAIAYNNRGLAKYNIGDYQGAIDDYTTATQINSKEESNYSSIFNENITSDNFQELFNKRLQLEEIKLKNAEPFKNRGDARVMLKDYIGAIIDYNMAININALYAKFRKIDDKTQAKVKNSVYADAYKNRGLAKIRLGQKNEGCIDITKAGELGCIEASEVIIKFCL